MRNQQTLTIGKRILLLCIGLVAAWETHAQAQNFRVDQYMFYQPLINPAAQSSYESLNGVLFYRNQWTQLEGSPVVSGGHISIPIKRYAIAPGLSIMNDKIGAHSYTRVSIPVSYEIKASVNSRLAFGLSYGHSRLQVDFSDLNIIDTNDPVSAITESTALNNFHWGLYYYGGLAMSNFGNQIFQGGSDAVDLRNSNRINFKFHAGLALHEILKGGYDTRSLKIKDMRYLLWFSTLVRAVNGQPVNADFNFMFELEGAFGVGTSISTTNDITGMLRVPIGAGVKLGYAYEHANDETANLGATHEVMILFELQDKKQRGNLVIPRF